MMAIDSVRLSRRLPSLERALFALAAILLGWYVVQKASTAYYQAVSSRELETIRMSMPRTTAPPKTTLPIGSLVGRIDIPRLGVSAIVREGDNTSTLRRSVGHVPQTAFPGEPGNSGLAGHRDTFFRGLRNARAGDRITVTTRDAVLRYVIRNTRVVEPDDVSVLKPTSGRTLTLVTCYPFSYIGAAPQRFIVQAEMTDDRRQ
jgi:sortase A